jgi:hypothetical protein
LTDEAITAHLTGDAHLGLYPLLDGDKCHWLAADFDGPAAMLDALACLKAARAIGVPAALEVSRSGVGGHAWIFFAGAVPAVSARRLGAGPLREDRDARADGPLVLRPALCGCRSPLDAEFPGLVPPPEPVGYAVGIATRFAGC